MVEHGLYIIKDSFYRDFPDPRMMSNKGGRPFYYCVKDADGLLWMLPISSRVDKYRAIVEREESKRGECILCHIGVVFGEERAFCISNIFPITPEYVERGFMAQGHHYIVANERLTKELHSKAMRYLKLVELRKLRPMVDIMKIKQALLSPK